MGEEPCCDLRTVGSCSTSASWSGCGPTRPSWPGDSRLICGPAPSGPRSTSAGTVAEIAQVLSARAPLYQEVADVAIETLDRTPVEIAALILDLWRR